MQYVEVRLRVAGLSLWGLTWSLTTARDGEFVERHRPSIMFGFPEHTIMFGNREHGGMLRGVASRTSTELAHPDRDELQLTTVMAALSDPVRMGIVAYLASLGQNGEPACVSFALPVSKSTQSGHFKVLREAGLIRQRDEGTRRLNRLRRDDLDARFPGLLDLVTAQAPEAKTGDQLEPPAQ